jgi:uncharacterized protein (TIGR02266 family)
MFDGMSKTGGESDEAQQSFERVKVRLGGVKATSRPSADPHSAAVTALLASDFLDHADLKDKVKDHPILTQSNLAELRTFSRAILHCLTQLGGDWFPMEGKAPPLGELHEEGAKQRDALVELLGKVKDPTVKAIVDSIRKGDGDVDLVLDLRALAALVDAYSFSIGGTSAKAQAEKARGLADKAEAKLAEGEPKEHAEWRDNVVKAWTLFAPKYEAMATAARKVTGEGVDSTKFPPLYTVSRARRTRKRGSITPPPESLRPVSITQKPTDEQKPTSEPATEQTPPHDTREQKPTSEPPQVDLPPVSLAPNSNSRRTSPRYAIEMEVGFGSESNFYVGFTENLSASGVFVATYSPKPMGTKVEVTLALPTGAHLELHGTVRWIRNASPSGDTWPGMGVQFDKLSDDQEAKIREFIRIRDPLFFDDD